MTEHHHGHARAGGTDREIDARRIVEIGAWLLGTTVGAFVIASLVYLALAGQARKEMLKLLDKYNGLWARLTGPKQVSVNEIEDLAESVYNCTLCGRCMETCPFGFQTFDLWIKIRDLIHELGFQGKNIAKLEDLLSTTKNPYGLDSETRLDWVDYTNFTNLPQKENAELAYFIGCTTAFKGANQQIAYSIVSILNVMEEDWAVLGTDEWCCGSPVFLAGDKETAIEYATRNVKLIEKRGIKTVITGCSGCFRILKWEYPIRRLRHCMVRAGYKKWVEAGFPRGADGRPPAEYFNRARDEWVRVTHDEAADCVAKALVDIARTYTGEEGARKLPAQKYDPETFEAMKGAGTQCLKFRGGMPLLGVTRVFGMYRMANSMALLDAKIRGVGPDQAVGGRGFDNYSWHTDLPPGHPMVSGQQTVEFDLHAVDHAKTQDTRELYARVARQRGSGVAEARDGMCQACHVRMRVQIWVEVKKNEQIFQCESCSRVYYYEPPPPTVVVEP